MRLSDVDTPALIWDLDVVERNLERMSLLASSHGVAHRPHAKSHKTWELSAMQRQAGAIGHTVAKVGEAEVMVEGGFKDLLIAYPVLGSSKINRIAHLLDAGADITIAVDSLEVARAASADLGHRSHPGGPPRNRLGILIEIDSGFGRCGVQNLEQALELAEGIARLPGVELRGVMGFAGQAYTEPNTERRRQIGVEEGRQAAEVGQALVAAGYEAPVVSVGCTPSTYGAVAAGGVTEVRAGVYVFNDRKQATLDAGLADCALTVLATVVSRPTPDRMIVDAGLKALAGEDYGWGTYGCLADQTEIVVSWAAEEHGVIELADPALGRPIGSRVRIIPNHACGTVNMHDTARIVRGPEVVDEWSIVARGKLR